MSACSNTNLYVREAYYLDGDYRQCNIAVLVWQVPGGRYTSTLFQINPDTTPKQGKEWVQSRKTTALYTPGNETTYTDDRSLPVVQADFYPAIHLTADLDYQCLTQLLKNQHWCRCSILFINIR